MQYEKKGIHIDKMREVLHGVKTYIIKIASDFTKCDDTVRTQHGNWVKYSVAKIFGGPYKEEKQRGETGNGE